MVKSNKDTEYSRPSDITELELLSKEADIIAASKNNNTIRALENAVNHFTRVYGGQLPCTDVELKKYLITYAGVLSISTLEQRRVLIGRWHKEQGLRHNPNDSDLIREIMRGIRKKYNRKQKRAAPAAIEMLAQTVNYLDKIISEHNTKNCETKVEVKRTKAILLQALRDKAMLLVSFWLGFRSDELIHLRLCDLTFNWDESPPNFELYLPRSKTDVDGKGQTKKLQALKELCPMMALRDWIEVSCEGVESLRLNNSELPIFVKVSAWGVIGTQNIHANSVNKMLKTLFKKAGIKSENYSSHSMRRGLANWIIKKEASMSDLMEWVGWSDTRTAMRYIDGRDSLPNKIIENKGLFIEKPYQSNLLNSEG